MQQTSGLVDERHRDDGGLNGTQSNNSNMPASARFGDLVRRLREEAALCHKEKLVDEAELLEATAKSLDAGPQVRRDGKMLELWIKKIQRLYAMTNTQLVDEALKSNASEYDVVMVMMDRLDPDWTSRHDYLKPEN